MARALELTAPNAGMQVLDVGAGRGEVVLHAALSGAHAVGIDYSAAAVELTSSTVSTVGGRVRGKVSIIRADGCGMPFPENAYDVVLMLDIVEHLYPTQLDAAIAEAHRVLKPGGRLVIHTAPNALVHRLTYPLFRILHHIVRGTLLPRTLDEFNPVNQSVHVNKQTPWSLRRSLRKQFTKVRVWLEDTNPSSALLKPDAQEDRAWMRFFLCAARRHHPWKLFCCNHIFAVAVK